MFCFRLKAQLTVIVDKFATGHSYISFHDGGNVYVHEDAMPPNPFSISIQRIKLIKLKKEGEECTPADKKGEIKAH